MKLLNCTVLLFVMGFGLSAHAEERCQRNQDNDIRFVSEILQVCIDDYRDANAPYILKLRDGSKVELTYIGAGTYSDERIRVADAFYEIDAVSAKRFKKKKFKGMATIESVDSINMLTLSGSLGRGYNFLFLDP